MQTRREFLYQSFLAGGSIVTASAALAAAPAVKSSPDVIIYEGDYPGWPWVSAGADGALYCVWREGTIHGYSANGRLQLSVSRDQGKTWTRPTVIVDAPEIDDRNVAIVELPNKELLVTYNTYTAAQESLAVSVRSADGGKRWTKPETIDLPNTRTRAAAVVLASGNLLLPYYIAPGNGALAAISTDNGRHWKTARVPDAEGFIGDEWTVLEVAPNRLLGLSRNSHKQTDGRFWKTESRDGGQTWSVPVATNVQSKRAPSPPHLVSYDKTPVLIYADRRMVSVSAVRSHDPNFVEWDVANRHPCYLYNADESPIRDSSYPVGVQVGARRWLIVDYEIREKSKRITGYFVDLPTDWK